MTTNEKINFCNKSGLIFYDNKCMYPKSPEDCEKEDQFTKPNYLTKSTTCTEMNEKDKEEYCKINNKSYHDGKCVSLKTEDMCPQNKYLKPDPKTNFTTCIKMSDDEIKNLCKELKKVFNNGQCIKGLTEEECKEKYDEDEPLFYKKVNKEKTKCVDLTIEKKMKMYLKLYHNRDTNHILMWLNNTKIFDSIGLLRDINGDVSVSKMVEDLLISNSDGSNKRELNDRIKGKGSWWCMKRENKCENGTPDYSYEGINHYKCKSCSSGYTLRNGVCRMCAGYKNGGWCTTNLKIINNSNNCTISSLYNPYFRKTGANNKIRRDTFKLYENECSIHHNTPSNSSYEMVEGRDTYKRCRCNNPYDHWANDYGGSEGSTCPKHLGYHCSNCYGGNARETAGRCTCTKTSRNAMQTHFGKQMCLPNQCRCNNGSTYRDTNCPVHNQEKCNSCMSGYTKYNNKCYSWSEALMLGKPPPNKLRR